MTQEEAKGGWVKAAKSAGISACVELAPSGGGIALRDSKDPHGPVLLFTPAEMDAFIDGAKRGEYDYLLEEAGHGAEKEEVAS